MRQGASLRWLTHLSPATEGARAVIAHIRRNDEINITHCDLLTAYDPTVQPVVAVGTDDIAIFDDAEVPEGFTNCPACWTAYVA